MKYRFFLSDHIGKGLIPECIVFMYRPQVVNYKRIEGKRSKLIEIPGRDLVKTIWQADKFDFTLIAAHLAWGNKNKHRDAGFDKIEDIFYRPCAYSKDPDIIILCDFNRFGDGQEAVKKLKYDPKKFLVPNVTFFDPSFNKQKEVTKASIRGKGVPGDNPQLISTTVSPNKMVYDIIFISRDVDEEFPAGSDGAVYGKDFGIIHFDESKGFGFQPGADSMNHETLKKAYSDHRPLWMRFKTDTDNLDGN